jgi:hypothetical protein
MTVTTSERTEPLTNMYMWLSCFPVFYSYPQTTLLLMQFHTLISSVIFYYLFNFGGVVLGIELSASHLLGRASTT